MAAVTQPVGSKQSQPDGEDAVREWLDALADGECSQAEFLNSMRQRYSADRDGNWEVLSLLDQYYRRGKIHTDVFTAMKTSLAGSAMGAREDAIASARPRSSAVVTIPAASSRTMPEMIPADSDTAIAEIGIGTVLRGRYRIIAVLGTGGMGTVFEAVDEERLDLVTSNRRIAIKVLHTAVTHRIELLDELRREFQNLQVLSHPSIVRVYEFDRDGPVAFFTMELIKGVLLSRVLAARSGAPLPRPQALAIIRDVGAALAHAHSRGVVHGDINPQNIFVAQSRDVRVMDFGASQRSVGGPLTPEGGVRVAPFATPGYASCQLQEGAQADARDDLFAFACVTYFLLSGKHPFGDHDAIQARDLGLKPRRPADITGPQWRSLKAGLRWNRERRPAEFVAWLEAFDLSGAAKRLDPLPSLLEAPRLKRRNYLLAAALLIAFVGLGGIGFWALTDYDSLARSVGSLSAKPPAQAAEEPAAADVSPAHPASAPVPAPAPAPAPALAPGPATAPVAQTAPATPAAAAVSAREAPRRQATLAAPASPVIPKAVAATAVDSGPAVASSSPASRVELVADSIDVASTEAVAHIALRRRGNLRKEAAFSWWTESGTAKPGVDFANVASHVEQLAAGQSLLTLNVPLAGTQRARSKSFYVVIDQADAATGLGSRTLSMVTLLPSD